MRAIFFLFFLIVTSHAWAIDRNEQQCDANIAGTFSYYKLAVSRSKEWCYAKNKNGDAQCDFEYSVHGLWPQCATGYPSNCATGAFAEDPIDKRAIMEFMPSKYLIKHEWEKHGRCAGLKRSSYFHTIENLYRNLHLPSLPPGRYTYDKLIATLTKNQTALRPEHIELACDEDMNGPRASATTLDEIRICYDRNGNFTACTEREKSCSKLTTLEVRY
ncbi:MAG: hypothetical protein AABY83_15495 [Pseudomonadota bacterium]|mgnify:CR=1 FL=1